MKLKRFWLFSAVAVTIFSVLTLGYISNLKAGIADNILRLHIVGASNSGYDQTLKLHVRDRILTDFSDILKNCSSLAEARETVNANKAAIEAAAEDELLRYGCTDPVTAEVGRCSFPTKVYGCVALPCGSYTALNIKIGDAKGENWWCVMYPPLCVTDKTVVMSASSEEKLKSCLSREEYRLITGEETDIKIKFKIAEILGKYFK